MLHDTTFLYLLSHLHLLQLTIVHTSFQIVQMLCVLHVPPTNKASHPILFITSPIHINSPWPFVNNSNLMLCSVVSSPRPQPATSQHKYNKVIIISDGFSHPQQPLLSSTLSRNPPTTSRAGQISPIGLSVRKMYSFLPTWISGIHSLLHLRLHWGVLWDTVRRSKLKS